MADHAVAKSNLYATQDKTSANIHADQARACFQRDWEITDDFHSMLDDKWK
jgi:galactokinase/mevalonate kinase-like predicted kinase